jgi:hypothetical protein
MREIELQVGVAAVNILMPGGVPFAVKIERLVPIVEPAGAAIDPHADRQSGRRRPGEAQADIRPVVQGWARFAGREAVPTFDLHLQWVILEFGRGRRDSGDRDRCDIARRSGCWHDRRGRRRRRKRSGRRGDHAHIITTRLEASGHGALIFGAAR